MYVHVHNNKVLILQKYNYFYCQIVLRRNVAVLCFHENCRKIYFAEKKTFRRIHVHINHFYIFFYLTLLLTLSHPKIPSEDSNLWKRIQRWIMNSSFILTVLCEIGSKPNVLLQQTIARTMVFSQYPVLYSIWLNYNFTLK